MIPTPKFDVGMSVWAAWTVSGQQQDPCPDCLGSGKWSLTMPNGNTQDVQCSTCDCGRGYIASLKFEPDVRPLTIGSVRLDTNDKVNPISYMCEETGVGSGTIHYESRLFHTHEEAHQHATFLAAEHNANHQKQQMDDLLNRKKRPRNVSLLGHLRSQVNGYKDQIERLERHIASIS